jgi:quinohemoprotein ethanol dehydrogenase
LVFQGTADGRFVAYSADHGQKLWEVNLGTGIIAAPVTYQLDGRQYVSILAGWGGAWSMFGGNGSGAYKTPGRLWTFSLDGKQPLVPVKGQARPQPTTIAFEATPERIQKGMVRYAETCVFCHGVAATSGGTISDLCYSQPQVFRNYRGIVLDGEYAGMGMPSFRDRLSADDVEAIRLFVLSQRAKLTGRK